MLAVSPFVHSNYNFIMESSSKLKDHFIRFGETNLIRSTHIIEFSNILSNINQAIQLELGIFEYALNYANSKYDKNYIVPIYNDRVHFIKTNLDINNVRIGNKYLLNAIKNHIVNPRHVAFMTPAEIHPEKWKHLNDKKEFIEHKEKNVEYSNAFKCEKCGESKSKTYCVQTQSADEASTTFVKCLVCNDTYKLE